MTNTERRRTPRHPIDIKATLITPTASVPAHVLDIGSGGIRVLSPDPVLPETDIVLSLATREQTLLSGSILWAIEVQDGDGAPAFEMGIEAEAFILKEQEAIGHADRESLVREIVSRVRREQDQGSCCNSLRINSSK
jgi:hypothetical protein